MTDKNIQEKIKRNNHCPICKRPMTLLSVSDIFRRRKLREVKSKFILDFRDLQKEQEIKQETLAEVEKISKIVNFKSKKDRTFFENKLGEMTDKNIQERIEKEIIDMMTEWEPSNFTVCPECRVDDFCHIEGCKFQDDDIINRITNRILKERKETLAFVRKEIEKEVEYYEVNDIFGFSSVENLRIRKIVLTILNKLKSKLEEK